MVAGSVTIVIGIGAFSVGCVALGIWWHLASEAAQIPPKRIGIMLLCCAALLISNSPIAGGIILAVEALCSRYTILVENRSLLALKNVHVSGGGADVELKTIMPGKTAQGDLRVQHDDALSFRAETDQISLKKEIDTYVTPGLGGETKISVDRDLSISSTSR